MLTIGCHLSSSAGFLAMGQAALSIGATTFQFFTRNPRGSKAKPIDSEDITAFLALHSSHGIGKLVAHAPYTINPCSHAPETRQFALETMMADLDRMEYIPGNFYNFHPGSHTGQGIEVGINQIAETLNTIIKPTQHTMILLETMAGKGTEVGSHFEELREIMERVTLRDHVGVCLDTCHVWDAGYDIVNHLDDVLTQFDEIIGLKNLHAIHVNDSLNPLGAHKDRHACIGKGYLGLNCFEQIVNHPVLSKLPMILETPNNLDGYAEEIKLLRGFCHAF